MASHSHERSTLLKRTFFVILVLACSQIKFLNAAEESETETVLAATNSAVESQTTVEIAARNSPPSANVASSDPDYDSNSHSNSDSMLKIAARNSPSSTNAPSSDSDSKPDQMPEPIEGRSFLGRFFKRLFRPQEIKNETSSSITNHNNTTNSEDQNNSLLLKIVEAIVNKILKNVHKSVGDYNQAGTKPYIYTLIHNILFALVWVGKRIIKLIKFLIDFYKKIKGI
ncbi:hypothetical protein LSTR_LSTR008711 [Laodelphax striatellus]|uniref:Uncharacterized protein n=1 Tax=Laodelphax striatellus TaxID=195883 RepID=A0A482XL96_LAOST|nr:hypothetical protein LSTR_LSTR008711 [Laodelphax striatellus]